MTLKEKIAARLKAKAAGVNLSQKRIDAIVLRAEKGLTDESDDTQIDTNLDAINDLTPFKDIAALDDHERAKAKKLADEKEAARLKAIEEGKTEDVELPADTPEWMKVFMKQQAETNKALSDKLAAIQGEKVVNTRRSQYEKTLEGTNDKYKAKALKDFDRINFKDDEDFTSWLEGETEVAKEFVSVEPQFQSDRPNPAAGPTPAKEKVASADVVDDIINLI